MYFNLETAVPVRNEEEKQPDANFLGTFQVPQNWFTCVILSGFFFESTNSLLSVPAATPPERCSKLLNSVHSYKSIHSKNSSALITASVQTNC